jgi:signal peptidase I
MLELNFDPQAIADENRARTRRLITILTYSGAAAALLLFTLIVMFFRWTRSANLRAFRAGSDSMCPAICANERIIAAMDAFDSQPPRRGDVILFYFGPGTVTYMKRVIAIEGDSVAPGLEDSILVNGKSVQLPHACGNPIRNSSPDGGPIQFPATTVPQGSYFVIGDNLNSSYDSRISGFGLVKREQVLGKALFIYWSPGKSRFGCPTR